MDWIKNYLMSFHYYKLIRLEVNPLDTIWIGIIKMLQRKLDISQMDFNLIIRDNYIVVF